MSDAKKSEAEESAFAQEVDSIADQISYSKKPIVVTKNDSIKKRIDQGLSLINEHGSVLIISKGNGIQKEISIIEILKLKLSLKQYNKLSQVTTVEERDIESSKILTIPVLSVFLTKSDAACEWDQQ